MHNLYKNNLKFELCNYSYNYYIKKCNELIFKISLPEDIINIILNYLIFFDKNKIFENLRYQLKLSNQFYFPEYYKNNNNNKLIFYSKEKDYIDIIKKYSNYYPYILFINNYEGPNYYCCGILTIQNNKVIENCEWNN